MVSLTELKKFHMTLGLFFVSVAVISKYYLPEKICHPLPVLQHPSLAAV
jgi:hypothetical protein